LEPLLQESNLPKILIVDDHVTNLVALEAILQDLNIELVRANTGDEALFELLNQEFALVLLDVQMPGMDGFEVAELMRSHNKTMTIPIIFVTAISKEQQHIFKGYESGAVDYLFKPLNPDILLSKVKIFLELYLQKESLRQIVKQLEDKNQQLKHEINERIKAEQQLSKLAKAVEQSPASVIITDKETNIEFVNSKFEEVTGFPFKEVIGKNINCLKSGRTPENTYLDMLEKIHKGENWKGEINSQKKSGELFWEHVSISPIKGSEGEITHYVSVQEDITLRKEYENRLLHEANYDDITHLPNRILALDRITQESAMVRRMGLRMAVLFIDLDDFKRINESLGHHVGDTILAETAIRLTKLVRKGDTVARLGGDEFLIVLVDFDAERGAERSARKILDSFIKPFKVNQQEIVITASIGITYAPDDSLNPHVLLQNAEAAMYRAKESSPNSYQFFTPEMNTEVTQRLSLETNLRNALDNDEIDIYYQPIQEIETGRLIGAEALARWNSPVLGNVPPDLFIPVAESTGLIHTIGDWVLSHAMDQALRWKEEHGISLRMAVNFSSRQFSNANLAQSIIQVLKKPGLDPNMLEIEITEGLLMQGNSSTIDSLNRLKEFGVSLSIDDFGTGYSSLSYLKRFPIDTLKIDRSFIKNVASDKDDSVLIKAIIAMAHGLGLQVIAEGVETKEQLQFIQQEQCDLVQGYFYSKPLTAAKFSLYIRQCLES
jgi:diguanylate cyclase (GGDEF)-like protein/PAS domain S-box-containing protein